MAGSSMTFTPDYSNKVIKRLQIDWVSDDATGAVSASSSTAGIEIDGFLLKGVTVPGAGGLAPTTLYDITITDEYGVSLVDDAFCLDDLEDRSATVAESAPFLLSVAGDLGGGYPCVSGPITVSVAAAGNANAGTLHLFWTDGKIGRDWA